MTREQELREDISRLLEQNAEFRQEIERLRSQCEARGEWGIKLALAEAEIERLRRIETAARALKFSGYPAHGSGFVITVTGGNINDLEAALNQHPTPETKR